MIEEQDLQRRPTHQGMWCIIEVYASEEDGQFIAELPKGDPDGILAQALSIGIAQLREGSSIR